MGLVNFEYIPEFVGNIEEILENNGVILVEEKEIWEFARQREEIPYFENLYMMFLFSDFENLAETEGIGVDFEVCGLRSRVDLILANGKKIKFHDCEDWERALKLNK